jgi:glycosyltransferase involved in cell wall biosynthesis
MSGGMRILLVQTQAENAGAQEIARVLGNGLAAKGHEVSNLFFFKKSATFSEQPNTFYCVKSRPSSFRELMRLLWNLARHIRRTRPDAILTFQHYGNTIAAPIARLVSNAPVVANQVSALRTMNRLVRAFDLMLGLTGIFKAITVNSHDVRQVYEAYPKSYRDKLVHVAHGFAERTSHLSKPQARELFGLPGNAVLLGCVARLHPLKGLDHAIRMLPLEPSWQLALLGQGEDKARLTELADELGVADRVRFVGEVDPDRIGDFLAALDVFVFPSLAETFGLAAVEAAQAGVPVVANDLSVLREVLAVEGKPAALLVDAANTKEFAMTVSHALGDQNLRASLRQNGQRLKSLYSIDSMVKDYERILARVV